ncbi:SIR2 family protein [Planctomicrobium piriforme]|uniref:Zinc-ribbon domain-containing protein n=1 Tax=Planctomicrobium piriforme TaxID=1576369 RepID=A0A1I3LU06_9PLAN|nr:hypothetical protein [Planctomicrobium piriforme]SFI88264.1 hypothetical protein SAMN05421753_11366 [Planctomicrobium piriforme]
MTSNDDSDWDDDWPEDSDEADTIPCPSCGAEIHEDSPQCPVCGDYVIHRPGRVWDGKPLWYIALALLGIIAVIGTVLLLF